MFERTPHRREDEDSIKWMKRSSPLSDSRVVNRRGFGRTRGVCRGLWVSKLGRHPPPGHPLIYHGRGPQLSTTNKRQAVWATCHRAFNCLFLSPLSLSPPSPSTSLSHTHTSFSLTVSPPCPPHLSPFSLSPCFCSHLPFFFHVS